MSIRSYAPNVDVHYIGWLKEHREALSRAGTSLNIVCEVALDVIRSRKGKLHFVCGPISSGGVVNGFKSTRTEMNVNLVVFRRTIEYLFEEERRNMFSQMPFNEILIAFHREWTAAHPGEYCWPILHDLYEKLFATGKFEMFHFIHRYRTSVGADWEHERARHYGIRRRYLSRKLASELAAEVTVA